MKIRTITVRIESSNDDDVVVFTNRALDFLQHYRSKSFHEGNWLQDELTETGGFVLSIQHYYGRSKWRSIRVSGRKT